VVVQDPRHPLFGRRFRVAHRVTSPGRVASHIRVFFVSDSLPEKMILIPTAVIQPTLWQLSPTRLNRRAIEDILALARNDSLLSGSLSDDAPELIRPSSGETPDA